MRREERRDNAANVTAVCVFTEWRMAHHVSRTRLAIRSISIVIRYFAVDDMVTMYGLLPNQEWYKGLRIQSPLLMMGSSRFGGASWSAPEAVLPSLARRENFQSHLEEPDTTASRTQRSSKQRQHAAPVSSCSAAGQEICASTSCMLENNSDSEFD